MSMREKHETMASNCLDLLKELFSDCGSSGMVKHVDEILQSLLIIAQSPSFVPASAVRRKAFSVFAQLVKALTQDEELETAGKVSPGPWTLICGDLCRQEVASIVSVLRDLTILLETPIVAQLQPIIISVLAESILWLERSRRTYDSLVVIAEEGGIDEDEEEGGLISLVVGIIALVNGVAINDISEKILVGQMERIFFALGPYMQITVSNEFEWNSNPNDFIANEQDESAAVTIRLAFEGLLADSLDNPFVADETMSATSKVGLGLIKEGVVAKEDGNCQYWRLVEAGLFMVSFLDTSGSLKEIVKGCASFCVDQTVHELLRARSFLVLSKKADATAQFFPNDIVPILSHSIDCMSRGSPVLVYAATRAFAGFLTISLATVHTSNTTVELIMKPSGALECLAQMARQNTDETLHYALDTLTQLTSIYPSIPRLAGEPYYKFLLEILVERAADPFIPDEVLELVKIVHDAGIGTQEFEKLMSLFAAELLNWLRPDAECKLDTALEFLLFFVESTTVVPLQGHLLECILAVSAGGLETVGPETASKVADILRTCAVRLARNA